MAYFYEFELVLAGVILLSAMTVAGIRVWMKRKNEPLEKTEYSENEQPEEN